MTGPLGAFVYFLILLNSSICLASGQPPSMFSNTEVSQGGAHDHGQTHLDSGYGYNSHYYPRDSKWSYDEFPSASGYNGWKDPYPADSGYFDSDTDKGRYPYGQNEFQSEPSHFSAPHYNSNSHHSIEGYRRPAYPTANSFGSVLHDDESTPNLRTPPQPPYQTVLEYGGWKPSETKFNFPLYASSQANDDYASHKWSDSFNLPRPNDSPSYAPPLNIINSAMNGVRYLSGSSIKALPSDSEPWKPIQSHHDHDPPTERNVNHIYIQSNSNNEPEEVNLKLILVPTASSNTKLVTGGTHVTSEMPNHEVNLPPYPLALPENRRSKINAQLYFVRYKSPTLPPPTRHNRWESKHIFEKSRSPMLHFLISKRGSDKIKLI